MCCFSGRLQNIPTYGGPMNVSYQAYPNYQARSMQKENSSQQQQHQHQQMSVNTKISPKSNEGKILSPVPPYSPTEESNKAEGLIVIQ